MNCLSCGKPLRNGTKGWHASCARRFFGTNSIPDIALDEHQIEAIALNNVSKGLTVPGVQKKMSLHFSNQHKPRLTMVGYPAGYILKPSVKEFQALPEAEQLAMSMADAAGIRTVPHGLLEHQGAYAYITKRVDRVFTGTVIDGLLGMEDFCQLDLRLTQDKYKGSYERCAQIISRHSSQSGLDMTELYMRLVFSFLIGNSDMHLKNFSLVEIKPASGLYILAPAYDLLPVNIIMPEDKEQFALTMNGKKTNLRRKDFMVFAAACAIPEKSAERMLTKLLSMVPVFLSMVEESLLPEAMKTALAELIGGRSACLSPGESKPQ